MQTVQTWVCSEEGADELLQGGAVYLGVDIAVGLRAAGLLGAGGRRHGLHHRRLRVLQRDACDHGVGPRAVLRPPGRRPRMLPHAGRLAVGPLGRGVLRFPRVPRTRPLRLLLRHPHQDESHLPDFQPGRSHPKARLHLTQVSSRHLHGLVKKSNVS